jgi:hypothetical protein
MIDIEVKLGHRCSMLKINQEESTISIAQASSSEGKESRKNFKFDKIIDESSSQTEVFE